MKVITVILRAGEYGNICVVQWLSNVGGAV